MLELVGDFFGRKKECVVAGISGGEPPWAHEAGGSPRGVAAPWTLVDRCLLPLLCSQCQIFSNILEKTYLNFRAFGELLFSRYFYCIDNSENRQKNTIFTLFLLNYRKYKEGTEFVLLVSSISCLSKRIH